MQTLIQGSPYLAVVVFAFFVVLAVLWFVLPFAIFGIKPRLNRINQQLAQINKNVNKGE